VHKFEARPGCVLQAYRYALDPTPAQARALASHAGASRYAYNWAVSRIRATWNQRSAEESYGIPEDDRTPWRNWSLPSLRKDWNQAKDTVAPWWADNSKEAYSSGLAAAARAFDNYTASKNGKRKGPKMGRPRRKSKHSAVKSCRFTTGIIRAEADRHHVTLPRLGAIRTHESTRKLARRLETGRARILSAAIRLESDGRWFVSLQTETERKPGTPARPGVAAGVDLGVKHLAVVADSLGEIRFIPNPRHLSSSLGGLRRAGRRQSRRNGPTVYDPATGKKTRQNPSAGWEQAVAATGRAHARVRHLRADGLAKLTTSLAAEYGTVVVEDLNVAGMVRNKRLARHIADAGFGEIRRQLTYKTQWNGGQLVLAGRWFPSSKTCSGCGAVKAKLPLHARVYACDVCGLVRDRDENAAVNLAALATSGSTGPGVAGDPGAEALKIRGADRKTCRYDPGSGPGRRAGGVETGTRHGSGTDHGKTGTASPQGLAARRTSCPTGGPPRAHGQDVRCGRAVQDALFDLDEFCAPAELANAR